MAKNTIIIENILDEIDIIIKEQIVIFMYNAELEDRRIRLMEFIQNSEELLISRKARENLVSNVSNMGIKVLRKYDTCKENIEVKIGKKCRYHNKGYCKYQNKCKYYHAGQVCDEFLRNGKCETGQSCIYRHPRVCKYWIGDSGGCKREESCKYLHKAIPHTKSTDVKNVECEKEDTNNTNKDVESSDSGKNSMNELEEINADQKVGKMEEALASKVNTIKDLKEIESNLKVENATMKEQVDKLKRVVSNMHTELKELKLMRS
jgi:hypothetical protein